MKKLLLSPFAALLMAVVVPTTEAAGLSAGEVKELYDQAGALFEEGKYHEAKAKAIRAYAAFEKLERKDTVSLTRVHHLRRLCVISDELQENDKTIEYAIEVMSHARNDADRGFANGLIGSAYAKKGEYDKAIG